MTEALSQELHNEFAKRVDEHFKRIDARLDLIDKEMKSYTDLAISIEKLGLSTERMCGELEEQSRRLKQLEERDGERWRSTVGSIITVIVGAVLGFVFASLGIVG